MLLRLPPRGVAYLTFPLPEIWFPHDDCLHCYHTLAIEAIGLPGIFLDLRQVPSAWVNSLGLIVLHLPGLPLTAVDSMAPNHSLGRAGRIHILDRQTISQP